VIRLEHAASTVGGLVDRLETVRAELGEEQWFLVAHSWGAATAAMYAAAHPQRVRGLVLAHPMEISSQFCELFEDPLFDPNESWEHDPDVAEALWEDLEANCPDITGDGYDLTAIVRRVAAPALVVLGDRDSIHESSGKLWAELLNAPLVTLPDTGHWSFLEQPGQFQRAVTEFLMAHAVPRTMAAA
jgi:pimeloyl-ACP methyl ester carboxylesterase